MTVYRLPFDDDTKWQGGGNWDDPGGTAHGPGGQAYAFDLGHPVGGVVRAARGGTVAFVENNDGNTNDDPNVPGYGTAILIRHIDGTVAAYDHLKFQSTTVVKDQYVFQGEKIALSGNTGHSSSPHLHFDLRTYWNGPSDLGPTVPVQFEDKNHVSWRPMKGDVLASNNSTTRQEEWRWCANCQGLYFSGKPSQGTVGGVCPSGGGVHVHGGSANYILTVGSGAQGQADWRWCHKCQGLFFGGNADPKCPAGGAHSKTGSGSYVLATSAGAPGQADWRWCHKCQGLFFGVNAGSTCPAGGAHSQTGSGNYHLVMMGAGDPQSDWRWCNKCQGMFFGGNAGSKCPAGGAHSKTGSGNYVLVWDYTPPNAPGQPDWRWCSKCQGLFFGGNPGSKCPAGGAHSKTGSGSYVLATSAGAPGQADWRWCHKCQGLFFGGNAGSKCPDGGSHSKTGSGNYSILL